MLSPNEIGDRLETIGSKIMGGRKVPRSGAGKFWKLDFTDMLRYIYSCKGTEKPRIAITADMWREAVSAARGSRGSGDGYTPAMVIGLNIGTDDEIILVAQELSSWKESQTRDPDDLVLAADKARARVKRATRSRLG